MDEESLRRCPLSPVHEPNLLTDSTPPPPLELPDLLKGENLEGQEGRPRSVSRAGMTPGTHDSNGASFVGLAPPPHAITPIHAPPEVCVSGEGGTSVLSPLEQTSPPGEVLERRAVDADDDVGTVPASVKEEEEEEEESCSSDEDAVMALLSLQRVPSAVEPLDSMATPASVGGKRRADSPADYGTRHSPVPKLSDTGESRYFWCAMDGSPQACARALHRAIPVRGAARGGSRAQQPLPA